MISQKDAELHEAASSFHALRSSLSQAQQLAAKEAEQTKAVIAEARIALTEQRSSIVRQAEVFLQEQNAQTSNIIRDLRARLAAAEASPQRSQNERLSSERDLQTLR